MQLPGGDLTESLEPAVATVPAAVCESPDAAGWGSAVVDDLGPTRHTPPHGGAVTELAPLVVVVLVVAAFAAGIIDSIAGGGGLITVPALVLAGVDPVTALSTNKLQGTFGSSTACLSYARRGLVDLRTQIRPASMAFVASIAGASLVTSLPSDTLRYGLPVLLIGVAGFFAFQPGLTDADRKARLSPTALALTAVPLVGFYDGLLGPGAGSFYMVALILLAGQGVLKATAHTKLLNAASNVGALLYFAVVAPPLWLVGVAMGLAQVAGAHVGSALAVRNGASLIKPLLVVTSTALAVRLVWQLW